MAFDENGLVIKRYNEILTDIQDDQIANIPQKFKYQDNKIIHQLNSVYALQVERVAQLVEAAFDATKLQSAEGRHLEELGFIRGVYRLSSSPSNTSSQYAWLVPGTVIPAGTVFTSSTLSDEAVNVQDVTGNTSEVRELKYVVNTIIANTVYTVIIDGVSYSITSGASPVPGDIETALETEINTVSPGEYDVQTTGGPILTTISSSTSGKDIDFQSGTTYINATEVKKYFYIQLTENGPVEIPSETMDGTLSPISGLLSTLNDEAFNPGRDRETDAELRLRIVEGDSGGGTGTVLTIQDALITNVAGVAFARVIENTNEYPTDSDGRPQGSYEPLVLGGTDEAVAQEVWRTKPAGIRLWGNTDVFITDSSGVERHINFSRPVAVHLAVRVQYEVYDEEELTQELSQAITDAVMEYVNNLSIGKDFIPTRLYGAIYSNTSGLGRIVVDSAQIASPGTVPGTYSTDDIPVSDIEYASTTESDIAIEAIV